MNIKRLKSKIVRKISDHRLLILPGSILIIFLLTLLTLFTLFPRTPRAPRLKIDKGDSLYTTANKIYSSSLGQKDGTPTVSFSRGEAQLKFVLVGSAKTKPIKNSRTSLTFPNALPSIDLVYTTLPHGLKEDIVVHQKLNSNVILFDLVINNASSKQLTNNYYSHIFYNNKNEYAFHFDKPYAIDQAGNRTDNVLLQITKDQPLSDHYSLKIILDQTWLDDPARSYPITIDPTIVHDTTSEFAAGTMNRMKDTGSGSAPTLETYYQELSADEYTVGLWHMNEGSDNSCSGGEDVCDSSNNSVHGIFGGNAAFSSTSKLGSYSVAFDGTDDYITFGDVDVMDSASKFTFATWFNRTSDMDINSSHNIQNILLAQASSSANDNLEIGTNGSTIDIYIDTTGGVNTLSVEAGIQNNRWYHLAVVYDSSIAQSLKVYLDGKSLTSWSTPTGALDSSSTSPLSLGISRAGSDNNGDFNGYLDESYITLRPLSSTEIKAAASRRPSSVYTSEVLDLGGANSFVTSWNSLSWTELGVGTGDGETLYDNSNLVAQWNFNETSGTSASNAAGSCGSACNGTLTNFASTSSQDQAAGSGWTSANRRWGGGALMFDGTNDYVNTGSDSSLNFTSGNFTLEGWFNFRTLTPEQLLLGNGQASTNGYYFYWDTTIDSIRFTTNQAGARQDSFTNANPFSTGEWVHLVATRNGSSVQLYVNGKNATRTSASHVNPVSANHDFAIGIYATDQTTSPFNGVIDSVRVYSRALTPAEILSNYNSSNIEFQTRVGNDTSPDDGDWEEWRPITNEADLENYNTPYLYDSTHANLISYWPMNETADNSCSGGQDACDPVSGHHGIDTGGSRIIDGKFGKARSFDGTDDRINIYSSGLASAFDPTLGTVALWMKIPDASIWSDSSNDYAFILAADSTSNLIRIYRSLNEITVNYAAGGTYEGQDIVYSGTDWVHVAMTWDKPSDQVKVYFNGQLEGTSTALGTWNGSIASNRANIGTRVDSTDPFKGYIDEVLLYDTPLSADEIYQLAQKGSTGPEGLQTTTSSVIKTEGNYSQKITNNTSLVDAYTVGLWHLDETGGSGAYVKDVSGNNNHGTPTGTIIVEGITNKARNFNGTSDLVDFGDAADQSGSYTLETWVKANSVAGGGRIIVKDTNSVGWAIQIGGPPGDGAIRYYDRSLSIISTDTSAGEVKVGEWTHIATVFNTTNDTKTIFINGSQKAQSTGVTGDPINNSASLGIGGNPTVSQAYFNGTIDEVKISNIARSASEIAESYRLGRDHYLNQTISSTDLSSKTSLPFYIAADRPGTYLQSTIGESAYAVGQPDANTAGLWRLEEQSGSGAYLMDSSDNSNHGTPTGTTFTEGKIGKARSFNGTSDYIDMGDPTAVDFGADDFSLEAWVKRDTIGATQMIISKDSDSTGRQFFLAFISTNVVRVSYITSSNQVYLDSTVTITDYNWHHIVGQRDDNSFDIYIDGKLSNSGTTGGTHGTMQATSTPLRLGQRPYTSNLNYLHGTIDEVRISDVARSADEIRQAYEYGMGLRSHDITIDFAASLDSGNLIADSDDLSFTVDATLYGLDSKGSMLFAGDKIIVRENYDGTEYLAQGTVTAVTASTGATTIASWDSGSTFPSGGYTASASVFKWQREYWPIGNNTLSSHLDAVTNLSLRLTNGAESRTVWLDDLKSSGGYLTTPGGSTITSSTGNRYFQYRTVLTSLDEAVSATLSAVTLDYDTNSPPATPVLDSPSDTAANQSLTPALKTTTTDADSDYLRYKIELCEDAGMSVNCQTFDQTSSQTGWSGQNTQSNTAYTSGVLNWYNQSWGYRIKITIDNTKVAGDLTDFPIYLDLADLPAGFHTNVNQTDARDIRITKGDGTTELPREVVFYNSSTDTGEVHVKYAGTLSSSSDTDIYIYYGNAAASDYGATDTYGRNNVWDSNYIGVYHLNESSGTHYSSTGSHDSTTVAVTQQGANIGNIYNADEFASTNNISFNDNDAYSVNTTNQFTAEAWVKLDTLAVRTEPLNKGAGSNYEWGVRIETNGSLRGEVYTPTGGAYLTAVSAASQITTATWYHLALSTNISTPRTDVYRNGVSLANSTTPSGSYANGTAAMRIGERADGANDTDGVIDEVRFSNIARSANWLLTQYNNQSNSSTFYSYTAQEPASEGVLATYTIQTALDPATTYYWRSYAIDPAGTNTWSSTQGTPYSFTTTSAPTAPTDPWAEGQVNPSGITDLTPEFSAVHNDSNGDPAVYYEIEVNTASDFTGTVMWDSNQTAMTSTANGARSPDISYAGTALSYNGATYYWRIRFTDDLGATGAWSATQNFTTNTPPATPTLDSPTDTATNQSLTPALKTSTTDSDSDYVRYKIELCEDVGMSSNCQTFDQTSSQTGWSGQNTQSNTAYTSGTQATYTIQSALSPATTYYWRSYAIDPAGTNTWGNTQSTPYSFTTRSAYEPLSCVIHESSNDTSLTITWIDREINEDNYKLEKATNGGGFAAYQTLAADSTSYQDTSISQGNTYQYRIAPYFTNDSSYGDWCITNTLTISISPFSFELLQLNGLKLN